MSKIHEMYDSHLHPHRDDDDFFGRFSESAARFIGSSHFLVGQTIVVACWIIINLIALGYRWDPYPFILLNLVFSTQAAYAAPLILLAQTRQAERDRQKLEFEWAVDKENFRILKALEVSLLKVSTELHDKLHDGLVVKISDKLNGEFVNTNGRTAWRITNGGGYGISMEIDEMKEFLTILSSTIKFHDTQAYPQESFKDNINE